MIEDRLSVVQYALCHDLQRQIEASYLSTVDKVRVAWSISIIESILTKEQQKGLFKLLYDKHFDMVGEQEEGDELSISDVSMSLKKKILIRIAQNLFLPVEQKTKKDLVDDIRGMADSCWQHAPTRLVRKVRNIEHIAVNDMIHLALAKTLDWDVYGDVLMKLKPERSVCFTYAKDAFCLQPTDFNDLICIKRRNPHYRVAAPMRLYQFSDLMQVAFRKHGSWKGISNALSERSERSLKRKRTMVERRTQRRNERRLELETAFSERQLEIRDDSRLCEGYLAKKEGDLELARRIAVIMDQMRFYHSETNYEAIREEEFEQARLEEFWVDSEEISDIAKTRALSEWVSTHRENLDAKMEEFVFPRSLRKEVGTLIKLTRQ